MAFPPALLRAEIESAVASKLGVNFSIREKPLAPCIPSGIPSINLPRGTLSELYGPSSSGKTGTIFGALARVTRLPECCALIDGADTFDPVSGSEAGIDLSQLLWIRCGGNAEHALKAADLVVHGGGFGMVVVDLDGLPARDVRRISLASWFRLRHAVEKTNTALVVVEQDLNAASASTVQIQTSRSTTEFQGALMQGMGVLAALGPRLRREAPYALYSVFRP
jgi:recombination protein RecA